MKTFMNDIMQKMHDVDGPSLIACRQAAFFKNMSTLFLRALITYEQDRSRDVSYQKVVVQKCLNMLKSVSSANAV